MKKALTFGKNDYVYWSHEASRDSHYIGTQHMMIRIQTLPDALRKTLATIGLYNQDTCTRGTMPTVHTIIDNAKVTESLLDTRLTLSLPKPMRVFIRHSDGKPVFINATYVEEIETFFNSNSTWRQGTSPVDPLIYGNNVGLVLPFRSPDGVAIMASIKEALK